jgi:hypothetical protein
MPSSGARSGTKPSRSGRGAGDGRVAILVPLVCGHDMPAEKTPIATSRTDRFYVCSSGCGVQKAKR